MNSSLKEKTTREGPASGESLGVPDSRYVGPIVYGGAKRRNEVGEEIAEEMEEGIAQGGERRDVLPKTQENQPGELARRKSLRLRKRLNIDEAISGSDCSLVAIEAGSRSGSESSLAAIGSGRLWQGAKRPRLEGDIESAEISSDEEMLNAPLSTRLQKSVAAKFKRAPRKTDSVAGSQAEGKTAAQLKSKVLEDVAIINKVAKTSNNLKGTFVRNLRDAAASIQEAVEVLSSRTIAEETRKLQVDNARMQTELASLRNELAQLKEDMKRTRIQGSVPTSTDMTEARLPVPQPHRRQEKTHRASSNPLSTIEEISRSVLVQVGDMLNARLASLEDRLLPEKRLRPSLAADKRKKATQSMPPTDGVSEQARGPTRSSEAVSPTRMTPTDPSSAPHEGQWERVSRKKKKKDKKEKVSGSRQESSTTQSQPRQNTQSRQQGKSHSQPIKKRVPKLRPPRSEAVVLTLQPGAEEKGATYATVLAEAKKKIALSDLGITALRFKRAATGGRILEIPGASSGQKADSLAQKLREVVSDEFVRIYRPIKCVDIRVTGLDDSVSSSDVVAAVAQLGGCSADQLRPGEIRRDFAGLGTIWLRCPVTAAKKISESGRLLVGWVSAQVKILDERPRRCYRCLEIGHLRVACTSEIDRSETCYRCGQVGHKARGCSAAPHCVVCAASGRPAGHRGGSSKCKQPRKNKGGSKTKDGPRVSLQSTSPSESANFRTEEIPMTTE